MRVNGSHPSRACWRVRARRRRSRSDPVKKNRRRARDRTRAGKGEAIGKAKGQARASAAASAWRPLPGPASLPTGRLLAFEGNIFVFGPPKTKMRSRLSPSCASDLPVKISEALDTTLQHGSSPRRSRGGAWLGLPIRSLSRRTSVAAKGHLGRSRFFHRKIGRSEGRAEAFGVALPPASLQQRRGLNPSGFLSREIFLFLVLQKQKCVLVSRLPALPIFL